MRVWPVGPEAGPGVEPARRPLGRPLEPDDLLAVWKPTIGERPLFDFPTGTLTRREVAAYLVSEALGWGIVPPTLLHDGPHGEGMLQHWIDVDPDADVVDMVNRDDPRLRRIALFDAIVNNTDRKGGHCLFDEERGVVVGIDHGLTFHHHWKLRTVIWDFAGEPVAPALADDVCRVLQEAERGALGHRLGTLLSAPELAAMLGRADDLLRAGVLPEPDGDYRAYPWPLV